MIDVNDDENENEQDEDDSEFDSITNDPYSDDEKEQMGSSEFFYDND